MKLLALLFTFLSVPVTAFASQSPSNFSFLKIIGGLSADIIIVLLAATLLRFVSKRYLKSLHSRQHSSLKNISQIIIRYHNTIALTVLLLVSLHGIAMYLAKNLWSTRMLLGTISLVLFALTSYFGFFMIKRREHYRLFYTLHMGTLVLAMFTAIFHIQYRLFSRLFL